MPVFEIHCVDCGVEILGQVTDSLYKGDSFYRMMCEACAFAKADSAFRLEGAVATLPTPATVSVSITNKNFVKNIHQNNATVEIAIDPSSTAAEAKINGGGGPVLLTMTNGSAPLSVSATGAGLVILVLQNPTHPAGNILDISSKAAVLFT